MLPHVDSFRAGHSIASLEALGRAISERGDQGERDRLLATIARIGGASAQVIYWQAGDIAYQAEPRFVRKTGHDGEPGRDTAALPLPIRMRTTDEKASGFHHGPVDGPVCRHQPDGHDACLCAGVERRTVRSRHRMVPCCVCRRDAKRPAIWMRHCALEAAGGAAVTAATALALAAEEAAAARPLRKRKPLLRPKPKPKPLLRPKRKLRLRPKPRLPRKPKPRLPPAKPRLRPGRS